MAQTGWYYPASVVNENVRSPHWNSPGNIVARAYQAYMTEGGTNSGGAPATNCSLAAHQMSDGLKATQYGFSSVLKPNARINGITALMVAAGHYSKDTWFSVVTATGSLQNKAKLRKRTDGLFRVDYYGGSTDKWGASTLTPAIVNNSAFGLIAAFTDDSNYAYSAYAFVLGLNVDYTDPTYSASATIETNKPLGTNIVYQLVLSNTNGIHNGYDIPVSISLPSGLSYVSQSGNGSYNPSTGKWNAVIVNGTATLTLTLATSSTGTKTVTASVDGFSTSISKTTNILAPSFTLASGLPSFVTQDEDVTYDITVTTDSPTLTSKDVNIEIPAGFTFVSATGDGTYNDSTEVWTAEFTNKTATLTFTMNAVTPEEYTQTISITSGSSLSKNIIILSSTVTDCYYREYELPANVLAYLQPGETYTIACNSKITDSSLTSIYLGLNNFKIAMIQGETEDLGTRVTYLDSIEWIYVTFVYDENETPKIRLYGQYVEISPSTSTCRFFGFELQQGEVTPYSEPVILFDLPQNLILDADYASISIPGNETTTPLIFNEINLSGRESDPNLIVKGLAISLDYEVGGEIGAKISITTAGVTNVQSVILSPGESSKVIGGEIDRWNFKNIDLTDLSFALELTNLSSNLRVALIKNVEFILYPFYTTARGKGFTWKDRHLREFNASLTSINGSVGGEKEVGLLTWSRKDGGIITKNSIQPLEFPIEFVIKDNTPEDAENTLTQISTWLNNRKDMIDNPILEPLIFDFMPDKVFNAAISDKIDVDRSLLYHNPSVIKCKTNVTVPSGVALNAEPTITGPTGLNKGIISVRPVITFSTDGSSSITITDNASATQILTINRTITAETILTIDCKNRTVTGNDNVDYTQYVDINTVWFNIRPGQFDYQITGGMIQNVIFYEGY